MLTEQQIKDNKQRFLDLIKSITIEGAQIDRLVKWLENSDFFVAPASTRYHGSYAGGLCEHSLNVYDALVRLYTSIPQEELKVTYEEDSLKVVALLHDISKAGLYELYTRNVKNEVTGAWEHVPEYRVMDEANRFIYGNHEQTSEYMVRTFINLTVEESTAILHHHGGMSWDSTKEDVGLVYNRYPLALLLHLADMSSTFIKERQLPNE